MNIVYNPVFLEHDTGNHPENISRLQSFGELEETSIRSGAEFISLVHTDPYIRRVKDISEQGGGMLNPDTILSGGSYNAAIHAVGAAIQASESGDMAFVRPPGHHAYPDHASGFCLFNNIAIAVKKLVAQGKRVLIFDFDGHMGDGTYHIFADSKEVLFWSLHQYPAFPGIGTQDQIGTGEGAGYSINIPLPPGAGDDVFMDAVNTFWPIASRFNPDIVAVSAGFDAHQFDPLLNLQLSTNVFYELGKHLASDFENIFAVLEGGYNTKYLPLCARNFIAGINNKDIHSKESPTRTAGNIFEEYKGRKETLISKLSSFWDLH